MSNPATEDWCVIDTETDGFRSPIHIVEVAAQRMRGFSPIGKPFHALLNHGVRIPQPARDVHGYSQRYLAKKGGDPTKVHTALCDYIGRSPVVAHNLAFDWNRCLGPEWERLGISPAGMFGFCNAKLARRVASNLDSVSLEALRSAFELKCSRAHSALGDVESVVDFLCRIAYPKLKRAGIRSFQDVTEFSSLTPVARCHSTIDQSVVQLEPIRPPRATEAWFFLDEQNACHGPLRLTDLPSVVKLGSTLVWTDRLNGWTRASDLAEFRDMIGQAKKTATIGAIGEAAGSRSDKAINEELLQVCRAIVSDGKVTDAELVFLTRWLEDNPYPGRWPAAEISHAIESITADGLVTMKEKQWLKELIDSLISGCS